jgi:hypothetical protein
MRLFFNEYYRLKPMRLNEIDGEIFTMEKGGEYNYEFLSIDEHEKEIAQLKEQLEKFKSPHNVNISSSEYAELLSYKSRLAKAIEVIQFYGHLDNWFADDLGEGRLFRLIDDEDESLEDSPFGRVSVGGKRAREFLANIKEKE